MADSTFIKKLQRISTDLRESGKTDFVIINALKQELHYAILDFIYNHPTYSRLVMYGGTLLRIAYDLTRMSEDLDFQTSEDIDLEKLKHELVAHFQSTYTFHIDVTTKAREDRDTKLMVIKFPILESFNLQDVQWKTIKIRFDINLFAQTNTFATEQVPIVHEGLTFAILTYPLSTLMASKVLAVLRRTTRGMGDATAACKPRDIFDLLWYMEKKVIPDMQYIQAKGESYETLYDLFYGNGSLKGLKFRVMNLQDNLFARDLAQFFFDTTDLDSWLSNWRKKFEYVITTYKIVKITELDAIRFGIDFSTDNRIIRYRFKTDEHTVYVEFAIQLSEYWFEDSDIQIGTGHRKIEIESTIESVQPLTELDYEYVGLFYKKIKEFRVRNKQVLLNDHFTTKLIRATADKLKPAEQVYMDRKILERIKFEDLL